MTHADSPKALRDGSRLWARLRDGTLLLLLGLCVTGCSSFHRAWNQAAHPPMCADPLEGRWEGTWLSDQNGHNGRLRALISHQSNDVYQAWFHAQYRKILSFAYTVDLRVQRGTNEHVFTGEEDLGKLAGGIYHYEGRMAPTHFFSTYRCRYDHGTFRMAPLP